MKRLWIFVALLAATVGHAQSGIIAASRYEQWARANVGVPGGIPSGSWTQCGSTIAAYGTSGSPASPSTINSAIAACGANQYVLLGPGTFWLNGSVIIQKSNVVVRGSGPTNTIIQVTTGASECVQASQALAICGGDNSPFIYPGKPGLTDWQFPNTSTYAFNWTGGYSQGATSITVANVGSAGISNGDIIVLDQVNDYAANNGQQVCDIGPSGGAWAIQCNQQQATGAPQYGGTYSGRTGMGSPAKDWSQEQQVKVTAGCSSACTGSGPFTLTISPGLYANNWNATSIAPSGYFVKPITMAGFENLTVNNVSGAASSNIGISNADGVWLKNVRSLYGKRNHVWSTNVTHAEIRDSYFYLAVAGSSESYGLELPDTTDSLIENNIFQGIASPFIGAGGSEGNVYGYNFAINQYYSDQTNFMQASYASHDAGNAFNLYEGDQVNALECDDIHGNSALDTFFRNWLNGRDYNTAGGGGNQPTVGTNAIDLDSYCRGFNIIGNVLGTPSYHTTYQSVEPPPASNCAVSVYEIGFAGGSLCDGSGGAGVSDDPQVFATLMRWGNYDTANATVRWDATESSPGAVTHIGAQSTPGSHTLPSSFYYSATPSFWTVVSGTQPPWPAIGPDVTGGSGPGGYSYNIPAANCYYNVLSGPTDGGGAALAFDASLCYSSTPTVATPTFSPSSGAPPQTVTIATTTSGATLCFTANNTNPTTNRGGACTAVNSATQTYTTPVSVASPEVLTAIGTKSGYANSAISTASYSAPVFQASPSSYNFGSLVVGSASSYVNFVVTNTGGANYVWTNVANVGGNTTDFVYVSSGCAPESGDTLGTVPPGHYCTLTMQFSPSAVGSRSTSVTFTDNAGNGTIALSGSGYVVLALPNPPTALIQSVQ